jgi:choline dehydrogenase-like flavoprotein
LVKKDGPSGEAVANGVEFSVKNGGAETVGVRREVILSAGKPQSPPITYSQPLFLRHRYVGTLQSPQILELSGIGQREVLKKAGAECVVDLPGVGENLREC